MLGIVVYSVLQGLLVVLVGVKYVVFYVNCVDVQGGDGICMVQEL